MTERPEGAPDAASDAEELEPEATDFEPETDDAEVDEIESELEAEEAGVDELEEEAPAPLGTEPAAAGAAGIAVPRRRGVIPPSVQRAPTQSELAVRVTDSASRFFVIATVVVFLAILGFGLVAGNGGFLTTTPAPSAAPSVSAA